MQPREKGPGLDRGKGREIAREKGWDCQALRAIGIGQNRRVSVYGEIVLEALTVAMEDFYRLNTETAKSIAFIMLGTAAKQDMRNK